MSSVETQQKLTPYSLRCPPPRWHPRPVEMASFCTPPKINKLLPQGTAQQARRGSWEFLAEKQHWSVCLTTIVCQIHGCTLFIVHALRNDSIRNPVILRIFPHLHAICKLPTCNVFCWTSPQKKLLNLPTCKCATVSQPLLPGVNLAHQNSGKIRGFDLRNWGRPSHI